MRRTLDLRQRVPLEVLGLDPRVRYTTVQIKDAFHERAKQLHPDAGGDSEKFKELNNAYEMLRSGSSLAQLRHGSTHPEYPGASYARSGNATGRSESARAEGASSRGRHTRTERQNDGDANRTWHYGGGTSYANQSTSDFYRPYSRNYADPSATGFTTAEIHRARRANQARMALSALFNLVLYGLFFYALYNLYLGWKLRTNPRPGSWSPQYDPSRPGFKDDDDGDDNLTWRERALRDRRLKEMAPQLQEHWSDEQKSEYLRDWNSKLKDREAQTRGNPGSSWPSSGHYAPSNSPVRFVVLTPTGGTQPKTINKRPSAEHTAANSASSSTPLPHDAGVESDE